jgi:hypothetical protein
LKAGDRYDPWILFWAGGDARRSDHVGEIAVMPAPLARTLLDVARRSAFTDPDLWL